MSDTTIQTLRMRKYDTLPLFTAVVEDDEGRAVNLFGASAWMILRTTDGSPVFGTNPNDLPITADGSYRPQLEILSPATGLVVYDWLPEETSTFTVAVYDVAVQVGWPDGSTLIAPTTHATQLIVRSGIVAPAGPTNLPPVAEFTWTAEFLVVHFLSTSTDPDGFIVAYAWDFGDGTTSTEPNPTHTYLTEGEYPVTLIVTDNDDASDDATHPVPLAAEPAPNLPPTAEFLWTVVST